MGLKMHETDLGIAVLREFKGWPWIIGLSARERGG
jgi:hypothetical protein